MDLIIGTAGHIDHGKTALVKAMTGTDADRLPEEKRRGITIDIGFAEMSLGDLHFGFVDVPGHERFVKNMLAGASGIDIVILVIAADDGVMPQTREHFDICRLLGIRSGIIAITKSDLVDDDTLELAKMEAAELVASTFLDGAPIIAVSSRTGEGIEEVKASLVHAAKSFDRPADRYAARLPIDRSFSMKGFGTVVTGTLASGEIAVGDEMELLPECRRVRIRGLQSHGRPVETIQSGRRVAVNLAGVDHGEIKRGMFLAEPGALRPTQMINVAVEVLDDASRPLRSRQRVRLHVGTAEVLSRVQIINGSGELLPGSHGFVQLTLESPVTVVPGERFIIRSYSPQTTIAGGSVVDNSPARHRRREFERVTEHLSTLSAAGNPVAMIDHFVTSAGRQGIDLRRLQARTGLKGDELRSKIQELAAAANLIAVADHLISLTAFTELKDTTTRVIEAFHKRQPLSKGISREDLREAVFANVPSAIVNAVIEAMTKEGRIGLDGETVRLANFSNLLSPAEIMVRDRIHLAIRTAGLSPERIDDVISSSVAGTTVSTQQAAKLLRLFLDSGEIIKVSDDLYFDQQVMDVLTAKLRAFAAASNDRLVDVGAFKDLAGVSRKYAIPLLEYFDREKITVRAGEKRLIR